MKLRFLVGVLIISFILISIYLTTKNQQSVLSICEQLKTKIDDLELEINSEKTKRCNVSSDCVYFSTNIATIANQCSVCINKENSNKVIELKESYDNAKKEDCDNIILNLVTCVFTYDKCLCEQNRCMETLS